MNHSLLPLALASLVPFLPAQENYWVGGTGGVKQVDAAGSLLQSVLPTSSRDVAVAPDGRVWFVASGITVLNADGTPFRTLTPSTGISPYGIAFDAAGHAWVSGGTGVEEFDAVGNSLGTITLPAAAPLNITIDAQGNKWIAHRVGPPGSVSRIDAITRAVTSHPLPGTSLILPITPYADARGPSSPSHIWVVGDNRGAGELVELDAAGTVLNVYVVDATARLQWLTADVDASGVTRNIWVGDWGNGNLHKVDAATGIKTTYPQGTGVYGVTFDGFGNLWATVRTGGLLRRLDPATANLEVVATVQATTQLSTRWQYATVANQGGDLDGDGAPNLIEVMSGSSPFDGCSTPPASIAVQGPTSIGSATALAVQANAGVLTGLAFAGGSASPGITLPGLGCAFRLDLATLFPATVTVVGPVLLPFTIPNQSGLIGTALAIQGVNAGVLSFTNVTALRFF